MSSTMINKDEGKETFSISVKVRDEDRKIFEHDKIGKVVEINFEKSVHTWEQLEYQMKTLCCQFEAVTTKGSDIDLYASIYNSISNTWMTMASYYGSEKRFVKLT
jgi:hypothetical protein